MPHMTGAKATIATLRAHKVDTIFGIPGVHTLPLYDAMRDEAGLRHVLARHEQGAGFMADGYARVSGRPGVVRMTSTSTTSVAISPPTCLPLTMLPWPVLSALKVCMQTARMLYKMPSARQYAVLAQR